MIDIAHQNIADATPDTKYIHPKSLPTVIPKKEQTNTFISANSFKIVPNVKSIPLLFELKFLASVVRLSHSFSSISSIM